MCNFIILFIMKNDETKKVSTNENPKRTQDIEALLLAQRFEFMFDAILAKIECAYLRAGGLANGPVIKDILSPDEFEMLFKISCLSQAMVRVEELAFNMKYGFGGDWSPQYCYICKRDVYFDSNREESIDFLQYVRDDGTIVVLMPELELSLSRGKSDVPCWHKRYGMEFVAKIYGNRRFVIQSSDLFFEKLKLEVSELDLFPMTESQYIDLKLCETHFLKKTVLTSEMYGASLIAYDVQQLSLMRVMELQRNISPQMWCEIFCWLNHKQEFSLELQNVLSNLPIEFLMNVFSGFTEKAIADIERSIQQAAENDDGDGDADEVGYPSLMYPFILLESTQHSNYAMKLFYRDGWFVEVFINCAIEFEMPTILNNRCYWVSFVQDVFEHPLLKPFLPQKNKN